MGESRLVPVLLALLMVSPASTLPAPASADTGEAKPPDPYFTVSPGTGTTDTVFMVDTRGSYIPNGTTVTLDWGDGNQTVNATGQLAHAYHRPGFYRITLTLEHDGESASSVAQVRVRDFAPSERANETGERIEEDDFQANDAVELLQSAPMERSSVGTVVALVSGLEMDAFPLSTDLGNVSLDYVQCSAAGCTNETENVTEAEDPTGLSTAAFSVMMQKAVNADYYAVDVVPEDGEVDLDAITQAFGFAEAVGADVAVSLLAPDAGFYDFPYTDLYEAYSKAAYPQAPGEPDSTELEPFLQGIVENRAEYDHGNRFRYNVPNGYNASRPIWFTGPAESPELRASHWDRMADGNDLGTKGPLAGAGETQRNGCAPLPQSIQHSDGKFPGLAEYQVYENATKLHQRLVPGDLSHLSPTQAEVVPRVAERLEERVCLELTLNMLARSGTAIVVPAGDNAEHANVDDPSEADWDAQSVAGLAGLPQTITVGATTSYEPLTDGDEYGTSRVVSPYSAAGPARSLEGVKPDVLAPGDIPSIIPGNLSYEPAVVYDFTDEFEDNTTFGDTVHASSLSIQNETLHVDGAAEPTGVHWTGLRDLPPQPLLTGEVDVTSTPGDNRSATQHVFAIQKGTTLPPVSGFGLTFRAIGNETVRVEAHVWNATGGEYCPPESLSCDVPSTEQFDTDRQLNVTMEDTGLATLTGHRTVTFEITDGENTASMTRRVPVEGDDQVCACKHLTFLAQDDESGPTSGAVFDNATAPGLGREAHAVYEPGVPVEVPGYDLGVRPSTRIAAAYVTAVLAVENQLLLTGETGPDRLQRLRGRLSQLAEPFPGVPVQVQGSGEINIENELKDSGLLPVREIEMTPDVGGLDMGNLPFENESRYRVHHANGTVRTNRISTSHANVTFTEISDLNNSSLRADTDSLQWHRVLDTGRMEKANDDTPEISFEAERRNGTWHARFSVDELPATPGVYATLVPIERSGDLQDLLFSENFTMPLTVTRTQDTSIDVSGTDLPEGASAWLMPPTEDDGDHLVYDPYLLAPGGHARVQEGQLRFGPRPAAGYSLSVATNASLPVPSEIGPDGVHDAGSQRDMAELSSHLHPSANDPEPLASLDADASLPVPVSYRFLDIQQAANFTVGPIEEPPTPESGLQNQRPRDPGVWNERGDPARGPGHALADPLPHGRTIEGWDIDLRSRAPPAGLGTNDSRATQDLYEERLDRGGDAFNHTTVTGFLDPRPYLAEENRPYDPVHLGTTFTLPQPADDVHGALYLPLELEQAGGFVEISTDRRRVIRSLSEDSVWTPQSPEGNAWSFDKDPRDQLHDASRGGLLSGDDHQHPMGRTQFGPEDRRAGGYVLPYSLHEVPEGADEIEVNLTIHPEPQSKVGRSLGRLPLDPLTGPRFNLDGAALYAWTNGRADRQEDRITGLDAGDPGRLADPDGSTPDPLEDPLFRVEPYHALGRAQGELMEVFVQGGDANLCVEAAATVCAQDDPDSFNRSTRQIEPEDLRYPFGHAMGPVFYEDLDVAYEHEPYGREVPRVHDVYPTEIQFRATGDNVWRVDEDALQAAGGLSAISLDAGSFPAEDLERVEEPFPDAPDAAPPPGTVPNHCLVDTGYGTATTLTPYGKRFCFEDGTVYDPLKNASVPFGVDRRIGIERDRVQDQQPFFEALDDTFALGQAKRGGCQQSGGDGFGCIGALLSAPAEIPDPQTVLPQGPDEPVWPVTHPGGIHQDDQVVWHKQNGSEDVVANGTLLWSGQANTNQSMIVLQSVFDTTDPNGTGSVMISFPNTTLAPRILPTIEGEAALDPKVPDPADVGRVHAFNIGEFAPHDIRLTAVPNLDQGQWKVPDLRVVPLQTLLTMQGTEQPWGNWQGQLAPTCRVPAEDGSCMGPPVDVRRSTQGTHQARFLTVPSPGTLVEDLLSDGSTSLDASQQLWSGRVPHTDALLLVRHNFTDPQILGNESAKLRLGLKGEGPAPGHVLATLEGVETFTPSDPSARPTRLDVFDLSGYQGRRATIQAQVQGNTTWNVHEARVVRAPPSPGPAPRDDPGLTQSDHPTVPAPALGGAPGGEQLRVGPAQLGKTDPDTEQTVAAPAGFTVDDDTGNVTLGKIHLVVGGDVDQGARVHVTDGHNLTIEDAVVVPRDPAYRWGIRVDENASLTLRNVTLMRGGHPRQAGAALDVAGNATLENVRLLGGGTGVHVAPEGRLNATNATIARFAVGASVEGTARLANAFVDGNLIGLAAREGVLAVRGGLFTSNRDGAVVTQDSVVAIENATFAWNGGGGQAAAVRTVEGLDDGHAVLHNATFHENTDAVRARASTELHDVRVRQDGGTVLHATPAAPVHASRLNASSSDAAVVVDAGGILTTNASYLRGATPIACTPAGEPETINLTSTRRDRTGPVDQPGLQPCDDANVDESPGQGATPETPDPSWRGIAARRFVQETSPALVVPGHNSTDLETLDASNDSLSVSLDQRDASLGELASEITVSGAAPDAADDWIRYRATPEGETGHRFARQHNLTVDRVPPTADIDVAATHVRGWTRATSMPVIVNATDAGSGRATTDLVASTLRPNLRQGFDDVTVLEGLRGGRAVLGHGSRANLPTVSGEETQLSAKVTDRAGNEDTTVVESVKVDNTPPRAWIHADNPCGNLLGYDVRWHGHDPMRGSQLRYPANWASSNNWSYDVSWAPLNVAWLGMALGLNLTDLLDLPDDEAQALIQDLATALGVQGTTTTTTSTLNDALAEQLGVGPPAAATDDLVPQLDLRLPLLAPPANPQVRNAMALERLDKAQGLTDVANDTADNATGLLLERWRSLGTFTRAQERVHLSPFVNLTDVVQDVEAFADQHPNLSKQKAREVLANADEAVERLQRIKANRSRAVADVALPSLLPNGTPVEERALLHKALGRPLETTEQDVQKLRDLVNQTLANLLSLRPLVASVRVDARDAVGNMESWQDPVIADAFAPTPLLYLLGDNVRERVAPLVMQPGATVDLKSLHTELSLMDPDCGISDVTLDLDLPASLNTSSVEKLYPRDGSVDIRIQDLLDIYPETVCGLQTPNVTARDVFGREKSLSVETILDRVPPEISGTTDLVDDVDNTGELPSGDDILSTVPLNGTAEDGYLELGTYEVNLGVDTRVGDCDVGAPIHEVAIDAQIGQRAETTLFRTYYGPNVTGNVTVNENTSVSVQGSFDLTVDAFGLEPDDLVNHSVSVDVCATDEAGQVGCERVDGGDGNGTVDATPPVCGPDRLGLGNVPNPPTYQPVPKVPELAGMGGREIPVNWSAVDTDSGLRDPVLLVRPQPIDENASLPLLDNVTLPGNLSEELDQTLLFVENQTQPWYTQQILLYELDQMLPDDPNGTLPLGDNLTDEIPIRDDAAIPFSYWSVLNESTSRFDLWREAWGDKWPETDWYHERLNDSGTPLEMAGEGEIAHHNFTENGTQELPRWLEGPVWHPVQLACVVSDQAGNVNVTDPVNVTLDTELPFVEWLAELDPTDPSLNDSQPLTDQLYPIEADDLVADPNNLSDPDHWFNRSPSIPLGVVEQVSGLQNLTVEAGVEGGGVRTSEDLAGQVGTSENDTPHARINSTTTFQLDPADLSAQDGYKWWMNLTVRDNVNNTWNDSMEVAFDLTDPIAELCELTGNLVDGFLPVDLYVFEACVENAPSAGPYRSPLVDESVEMVLENASGGEETHPANGTIELDMDTSGPKNATLEACDVAGNCDRAELGFNADLDSPITQLKSIPVDHVTTLLDDNRCLDSSAEEFVGATVHWLNDTSKVVFNVTDRQPDANTSIAVEDRVSGVQGLTVWARELDPDTLEPTGEEVLVGEPDLGNDTWRPSEEIELNLSKLTERVPYNFEVSGYDRVGNEEPPKNLTDHLVAWDPVDPTSTLETLPEFSPDLDPSFVGNVTDDVDPTNPSFDACLDEIDAKINASGTVSVEPHDIENASVGFDATLGNHSYEVNTSLDADTEGTQVEVCVRGRDRAANVGACSTTRTTIPDLTPPEAFLKDLLDDLVGGGFLPVNEFTEPTEYSFDPLENNTGPGTQSPIANVTLVIDAPNGTNASYQLDAGQVESNASMTFEYGPSGTYAAAIHACDDVGHCQTPREATFDVDLTAPTTVLDRITSAIRNTTLQSGVEVHWVGGSIDASFNATDADGGTGPANLTVYAQPLADGTLAENDTEASVEASKTDEGDLWATFDASFPSLDTDTIYRFEVNATDDAGNVEADPIDEPTPIDTHFAYDASPPEVTLEPIDDYVGQLAVTLTGNASDLTAGAESGLARLEVQATREDGSVDHENTTPTDTPEATDYSIDYELDPADEGTSVDLCVRAEDASTRVGACSSTRTTTLDLTPPDSSFDELVGELVDGFLNVSEHDDGTYSFSPTVANAGPGDQSPVHNVTLRVEGPDGFQDVENLTASELEAGAEVTFEYGGTGDYTATLTACDSVDNCEEAGQRAFLNFTVDLTPPDTVLEAFTDGLLNQTAVNGTDVAWVDGHVTATFNVSDDAGGSGAAGLEVTAQPVDESYQPDGASTTVEATLLETADTYARFEASFDGLASDQAYRFETNASDEVGNTEADENGPDPITDPAWANDATDPEATLDELATYTSDTLVPLTGTASDVSAGFESGLARLEVQTTREDGSVDRDNTTLSDTPEDTSYDLDYELLPEDEGQPVDLCVRAEDASTRVGACSTTRTTTLDLTPPDSSFDELVEELVGGFLNVNEHDDGTYSFSPTVANVGPGDQSPVHNVTLWISGPDGFQDVENLTASELEAGAEVTFEYGGTGDYTATLTACDSVDNCEAGGQRAFLNFTVDLVPPNSTLDTFTDGLLNQTEVNGTDVAWVDGHVTATFNVSDGDGVGPASLNVTAQPVNESYEPNATAATPIVETAATLLHDAGSNATFEASFDGLSADQAYRFETNASDDLGNTEANDTGPAPIDETAWAWDDTLPETTLDEVAPYRNDTVVPVHGHASDVADGFESALANLTVDVETLDPTGATTTDHDDIPLDGEETRYETTHDGGAADGSRLTYCTRATDDATQTGACSAEQTTVVDQTAPAVAVDPVTPVTADGWVTQLPLEVNLSVTNTTPASGDLGSPVRRASLYTTSADPADPGFDTTDLVRQGVEVEPGQTHDLTVDVGAHDGYTYEVRGYAADRAGNRLHRGSADPSQPVNLTGEVAAYPLDGDARDATANDLHATVAGADAVEAGHHGQAYELDRAGDAITVPSSPLVDDTTVTQRTVTAWVRAEDNATGQPQIVYDEGTATRGLNVYVADGRVHAGGWNTPSDESGWQGSWISAPLSSDVDHHVGLVLDAGTTVEADALELYVDGRLAGTADASQLWPHASDTGLGSGVGDTRLPAGPTAADDLTLDGVVDDVRVFDAALTEAEVARRAVNPYEAYPESQRPAATTLKVDTTLPTSNVTPQGSYQANASVDLTTADPAPQDGGSLASGVAHAEVQARVLDGEAYRHVPDPNTTAGTEWDYRRAIEVSNAGSSLSDHEVQVVLDTRSLVADGKMQPDCDDVRFTAADGTTQLDFWEEGGCDTSSTTFWVEVPSIPSDNTTVYLYYGNRDASSASDGPATFDFFDDFDDVPAGSEPDGSRWWISSGTSGDTLEVTDGGYLRIRTDSSSPQKTAQATSAVSGNQTLEWEMKFLEEDNIHAGLLWVDADRNTDGGCVGMVSGQHSGTVIESISSSNGCSSPSWDAASTSSDAWHDMRIERTAADSFVYYRDGSQVNSASTSLESDLYVSAPGPWEELAFSDGVQEIHLDDVRVRGYADPQPTADVGPEQTPQTEGPNGTSRWPEVDWNVDASEANATADLTFHDEDRVRVDLPFAVPLYGARHGTLWVDDNGVVGTEPGVRSGPSDANFMGQAVLAPAWGDWTTTASTDHGLVVDTRDPDHVTFLWRVSPEGSDSSTNAFAITIHRGGQVIVRYNDTELPDAGTVETIGVSAGDGERFAEIDPVPSTLEGRAPDRFDPTGGAWETITQVKDPQASTTVDLPTELFDTPLLLGTNSTDVAGNDEPLPNLSDTRAYVDTQPPVAQVAPAFDAVDDGVAGFSDHALRVNTTVFDHGAGVSDVSLTVTNLTDPDNETTEVPIETGNNVTTVTDYGIQHNARYRIEVTATDEVGHQTTSDPVEFTAKVLPIPDLGLERALAGGVYVDDTLVGAGLDDATGRVLGDRLSVKGNASADGEPVNLTFIHNGTKLDASVDSFQDHVSFEEVIDVAALDAAEAHDIRVRSETPEGSWKTIDFPFELSDDELLANSGAETADSWDLPTFPSGDRANRTTAAARTGDYGIELQAVEDDTYVPMANYTLSDEVPAGRHWAFVKIPEAPSNGNLTAFKLLDQEENAQFALRVDSSMDVWVLDGGSWRRSGESLLPGGWTKIEARDNGSEISLLLDNLPVTTVDRSGFSPVETITFRGAKPAVSGEMQVDGVGAAHHDPIRRELMEDTTFSSSLWNQQGNSSDYGEEWDPQGINKSFRINSTSESPLRFNRSLEPSEPPVKVALSVGAFDRGCGSSTGDLLQFDDGSGSSVLGLRCAEGELVASDSTDWSRTDANLTDERYNRVEITADAGTYDVHLNGEFVGTFDLSSEAPIEDVVIGGGDAVFWYDSIHIDRGRVPLRETFDGLISSNWTFPSPQNTTTRTVRVDDTEAFSGSSSVLVDSDGGVGETALLTRPVVLGEKGRAEVHVRVPDTGLYSGFFPFILDTDRTFDEPYMGVRLISPEPTSNDIQIVTEGSFDNTGESIEPGWHTFVFEYSFTGGNANWRILLDGTEIHSKEFFEPQVPQYLAFGDPYDGSTQDSGAGQVHVDDVVLLDRNRMPSLSLESTSDTTVTAGEQVQINGTLGPDVDEADSVEHLLVKVFEGVGGSLSGDGWEKVPKGPSWNWTWDTSGLAEGKYTVYFQTSQGARYDTAGRVYEVTNN